MDLISLLLVAFLGAENPPAAKEPLGKETTYFSGPLDKEGYVDYQAALNEQLGKGVTPETNANVLLWKVFGPMPDTKVNMPAPYFKLLGMEEPPAEGDYFIDLKTYLRDQAKLDPRAMDAILEQQSRATQRPWKGEHFPHLAGWLAANEKPLAVVLEATKRRDYFNPLVTDPLDKQPLLFALMPAAKKSREVVRALSARAMLRVELGKFDEAWQDLLTCHRLGRHVARGATLIEGLVGVAIDGIASNANLAYLERVPAKQVLDRLRDLQTLPPLNSAASKFELGERVLFLDSMQQIRRGRSNPDGIDAPGRKLTAAQLKALDKLDWTPALRNSNGWFDRMVVAMRHESLAEQREELAKINTDLRALGKRKGSDIAKFLGEFLPVRKSSEDIGDTLVLLTLPAFMAAHNAQLRSQQIHRNLQTAFALAAYYGEMKGYPEKLDDLTPKYLADAPMDIFTGKPLNYARAEKGYFFYSVGTNGKDEAGRSYGDEPRGDDLSVRMPLPEWKPKR